MFEMMMMMMMMITVMMMMMMIAMIPIPLRDVYINTIMPLHMNRHFFRPQASDIIPVTNDPISIPAKYRDWMVAAR